MLDESSLIQNRKAKQTKFIMKLQAANVILLSGTPTSGKYENLWTQAHLLGWDISESLYQRQYVNWNTIQVPGGQFVKVVDKLNPYKNVDRLKLKFREHGAVFLKTEDVMDLPQQTFIEMSILKPMVGWLGRRNEQSIVFIGKSFVQTKYFVKNILKFLSVFFIALNTAFKRFK